MMHATLIARIATAVLAAVSGGHRVPWEETPADKRESLFAGMLAIRSGDVTSAEQCHERWCEYRTNEGWTYGPTKDDEAKTHPDLVPWAELPAAQRLKSEVFFAVVKAAS